MFKWDFNRFSLFEKCIKASKTIHLGRKKSSQSQQKQILTFLDRMHILLVNIYTLQLWYLLYSAAKMLDGLDLIDSNK